MTDSIILRLTAASRWWRLTASLVRDASATRTILFFKGGELVDKHVGAITEGDLRKKFDALL